MMRKNPDDRFVDCNEIIDVMKQFRESPESFKIDLPPPTPVTPRSEPAAKKVDLEPVAAGRGNEFSIDTVPGGSESGTMPVAKPTRAPSIRRKRKKSAPKWLVPALIIGMISALIGVLFLMSQMVG